MSIDKHQNIIVLATKIAKNKINKVSKDHIDSLGDPEIFVIAYYTKVKKKIIF
jgi:hypothetical protein